MDKEVLKRLEGVDSAEWGRIVLQLTVYARYLLKSISWRTGSALMGVAAEDLAIKSILAIYDEKRNWDPSSNPDLLKYLKSVVRSEVSHLNDSKEYNTTHRFDETEDGETMEDPQNMADPSADHAIHLVQELTKSPEEILLDKQEDDNDKKIMDFFLETINGDDELEELALCIMAGRIKPREIAEQIGKDVKYVYNLKKRFMRKCEEFKANKTVK